MLIPYEAKGYPDVASRKFLLYIAEQASHLPILAMVDLDPDGIAILSTFKYGSSRLAHEYSGPSVKSSNERIHQINWLGLKWHGINKVLTEASAKDSSTPGNLRGLIRLTPRDRNKAMRMLEWEQCAQDGSEPEWRQELQTMLMLNVKAEMQIFEELPGGLCTWIRSKLSSEEDSMLL